MAKVPVDFSKVTTFPVVPEGTYRVKCTKADYVKAKSSGNSCIRATFKVLEGRRRGVSIVTNFTLVEASMWTLYAFMEAAGMRVQQGKMTVDTERFLNKIVNISVTVRTFNGNERNNVTAFAPDSPDSEYIDNSNGEEVEDEFEDDEEEDEPVPFDEDYEEKMQARKTGSRVKSSTPKKAPPPVEDEEEDDDDYEEPEEQPKAKRGRPKAAESSKTKPQTKKSEPKDEENDEEEFAFLDEDDE